METTAVAEMVNATQAMPALTAESKQKGDEGFRSAMDAMRLARALRGVSLSRLAFQQSLGPLSSTKPTLLLGMPPAVLPTNNNIHDKTNVTGNADERVQPERRVVDTHNTVVLAETLADLPESTVTAVANCATQLAIDVPDAELRAAAQDVLPFVTQLQPGRPMSYEDAVQLIAALATPELRRVTTLNLSHVVCPAAQPAAAPQTLINKINELRLRYPLPTRKHKDDDDNDEEEEEEEDEASMAHNAELKARCEQLQLPHAARYERALQSLAEYEMRVFPLLCNFLCTNKTLRVLRLDHNGLGAAQNGTSATATGSSEGAVESGGAVDLSALRALARVLDANEHLQLLDLSHNALGANGVGIVAKALTKNIALLVVDLSENELNVEPGETIEDPLYEGEDAVFGEPRTGLDALSELLKKNKFLRVLRLSGNGLHAGAELASAPEAESVLDEFQPDTDGTLVQDSRITAENATARTLLCPALQELIESWEELPLWKLVQPLQQFHRLQVLDLANNQLRVGGTRMLAAALACNRSLRVLDLTNNEIGFRGLHYLANLVLRSPCSVLHTLILRRNNLAGKKTSKAQQKAALRAMQAFAEAMKGNQVVRRLLLANNHLGPTLSAALLATLSEAGALEELDFDMNDACGEHAASFDPAAAHAIAALLHNNTQNTTNGSRGLRVLRFAGNNLRPEGLAVLFPAGSSSSSLPASLHSLYLARNELGHGGLGPLASALKTSTTLTSLDLSYNAIASVGELPAGLMQHPSLAYVNLAHNKLGSVTTSLLSVTPQHKGEGDFAAEVQLRETRRLFDALASMPALARLDLSWNDLLASHMEGLMSSLTRRPSAHDVAAPSLRWLDVRFNPKVPASTVASLVRTLGARAGMQVLYLSLPATTTTTDSATNNSNNDEEGESGATTTQSLLREMEEAVRQSETLMDLNCGLGSRGTVALDEAEDTTAGQLIGQMRRRLLLNALLANCDANKTQ